MFIPPDLGYQAANGGGGIQSTYSSGFRWDTFIPSVIGQTTTLISAIKGQSYQSGPSGYGGGGYGAPVGGYPGVNVGGGLNVGGEISPLTLLLIGGLVLMVMMRR